MNTFKPVLICDIDDVLWDMLPTWCSRYNWFAEYFNVATDWEPYRLLAPEDITDWDISKFLNKAESKLFYSMLNDNDLWDSVFKNQDKAFIATANELIEQLQEQYDMYICTATRYYQSHKIKKFLELFPSVDESKLVLVQNKWLLKADIVIDDRAETLQEFRKNGVRCVKINKPWNSWFKCESYNNFIEAANKLLQEV